MKSEQQQDKQYTQHKIFRLVRYMSEPDVLQELNSLKSLYNTQSSELNTFSTYLDRHHSQYLDELRVRNDQHAKTITHLQDLRAQLESLTSTAVARLEVSRRSSATRLEDRLADLNSRLASILAAREAKIQEGLSQLSTLQESRMSTWSSQLSDRNSEHAKLEDQERQLVARLKNMHEISDNINEQLRLTRQVRPDEKLRFEREQRELCEAVAAGNRRIELLDVCKAANAKVEADIGDKRQSISALHDEVAELKRALAAQRRRNQGLEQAGVHARQMRREALIFATKGGHPPSLPVAAVKTRLTPAQVAEVLLKKASITPKPQPRLRNGSSRQSLSLDKRREVE